MKTGGGAPAEQTAEQRHTRRSGSATGPVWDRAAGVRLAIRRFATDPAGACWMETAEVLEGRDFSLMLALSPLNPVGTLHMVAAEEPACSLLTALLGLASRGHNPRRPGLSQRFSTLPVKEDPRRLLSERITLRAHQDRWQHGEFYVKLDVPGRRLDLLTHDPTAAEAGTRRTAVSSGRAASSAGSRATAAWSSRGVATGSSR